MQCQKKGSRFVTILHEQVLRKGLLSSVLMTLLTWFGGPTPAAAQVASDSVPPSAIVYVSNVGGGISEGLPRFGHKSPGRVLRLR